MLEVKGKIVLVGHSFGGALASEFALANPDRLSHLVLIASAAEFRLNRFYRLVLRLPSPNLQLLAPFTRGWLGAPPQVLKEWYEHSLSTWSGRDLFPALQVPTLVVRGHLDVVFEKPQFEEVARLIPLAEEIDVGASGHMVMLERREAVNRAISRFLETGKRAFSQIDEDLEDVRRAELLKERPWLSYYDKGVPYTIAVPRVPAGQLLRSAARRFPRQPALIFEGRRITYRKLNGEANRFARFLLALNVKKGDRVMLVLPNLPQLVIAYFGSLKAGAVPVFTLPTNQPEELIRQIRNSGASILVTLTLFDSLIHQIKTQLEPSGASPLRHVIFAHIADYLPPVKRLAMSLSPKQRQRHLLDIPMDATTYVWKRFIPQYAPTPVEIDITPDDLAVIQYTGGTTTDPKGVMLSHRNLVANALQTRHWMADAQEGKERFLCVLPFSHSYGLTAALNVPVTLGATMILKAKFEVEDVLRAIHKYRPTIFPGVPQMYIAIQDFPRVRKYGISSIKACISGSAPLPVEVQEAFEKLTRGRLVEGYGLTEASPVTHANPLNGLRKVGSIGIPLPSTAGAPGGPAPGQAGRAGRSDRRAGRARPAGDVGLLERPARHSQSPYPKMAGCSPAMSPRWTPKATSASSPARPICGIPPAPASPLSPATWKKCCSRSRRSKRPPWSPSPASRSPSSSSRKTHPQPKPSLPTASGACPPSWSHAWSSAWTTSRAPSSAKSCAASWPAASRKTLPPCRRGEASAGWSHFRA